MSALLGLTAQALRTAYAAGSLSPVETVRAVLDAVERLNPILNAFYEIDHAGALAAAERSEARWRDGTSLGPLDGVPVSIKDHLPVAGFSSPRGAFNTGRAPAVEDCPAAARLREGGAVLFGKTVMPELSIMPVTDSVAFGPVRNPWALAHDAGGSSGGAAAAVAAGLGPLAVGSDGAGSIRTPAAYCGLVGLKPTHGRVPYFPAPTDRTVAGPIGRTVADVALMLSVIARPDGRDWMELPPEPNDYVEALHAPLRPLRIAASPTFGFLTLDREVADLFARATAAAAEAGHHVEIVDAVCEDATEISLVQAAPRFAGWLRDLPPADLARFPPATIRALEYFAAVDMDAIRRTQEMRDRLAVALTGLFARFDLLISPATAAPAPRLGAFYPDGDLIGPGCQSIGGFARPFNILHMPALAMPCGTTAAGLPVGLQIAGPKGADRLILQCAAALAPRISPPAGIAALP